MYTGEVEKIGGGEVLDRSWKRTRTIEDNVDMVAAVESQEQGNADARRWLLEQGKAAEGLSGGMIKNLSRLRMRMETR